MMSSTQNPQLGLGLTEKLLNKESAPPSSSISLEVKAEEHKDDIEMQQHSSAHYDDKSNVQIRNDVDHYIATQTERGLKWIWNRSKELGPLVIYPVVRSAKTSVLRTDDYIIGATTSIPAVIYDSLTVYNAGHFSFPLINSSITMVADTARLGASAWKAKGHDRWINPVAAINAALFATYIGMQTYAMTMNYSTGSIENWYNPIENLSWNPLESVVLANSHPVSQTNSGFKIFAVIAATQIGVNYGLTLGRELIIRHAVDSFNKLKHTIREDGLARHHDGETIGIRGTYMQRYASGEFASVVKWQDILGRCLEAILSLPSELGLAPRHDVATRLPSTKTWTNAKHWIHKNAGTKMRALSCIDACASQPEIKDDKGYEPQSFETVVNSKKAQFKTTFLYRDSMFHAGNTATNKIQHLYLKHFKEDRNRYYRGEALTPPLFLPTGNERPPEKNNWLKVASTNDFITNLFKKEGVTDEQIAPIYAEAMYYAMTGQAEKLNELSQKPITLSPSAPSLM